MGASGAAGTGNKCFLCKILHFFNILYYTHMIEKSYFYADNSASFLNIIVKFHPEVTISIAFQEKKVFVNRLKITKLIQKCHIFVTQLTVFFNVLFRYDWSQFPFKASYNQEIEISQTKIQFGEI